MSEVSLPAGPVVAAERGPASLEKDLEASSFGPPRSGDLCGKFPTEMLLSTPRTSPTAEALAIGGQLSRDTRRFSEAADRLLERAAGFSSALAGDWFL